MAVLLMAVLLLSGVAGVAGAISPEGNADGRASDIEDNGSANRAITITSEEVVQGSLRINPWNDNEDWYKMDVPYGKMLNASLYLIDYNTSNEYEHNFHLSLYGPPSGQGYTTLDSSATRFRWECVAGVQYWNTQSPQTMYVQVAVNRTGWPNYEVRTDPGYYTLSATISDIPEYNTTAAAETPGYLDGGTGPRGRAWFKLNPAPYVWQVMQAQVIPPANAVFSVHVYNIWDINRGWYLRNESWQNTPGLYQTARFNGCGGDFYVQLKGLSGNGTYKLTVGNAGKSMDENNVPSSAVLVRDLSPHYEFLDQGIDFVDWFKVNTTAGRPITQVYFMFDAGNFQDGSNFDLRVYDQGITQIASASIPVWHGYQHDDFTFLENVTVGYDGQVYFMVRATSFSGNQPTNFIPSRGWYALTFTLVNDPPVFSGPLPGIRMWEDATDESLVLSSYFTEPNNDTLSYMLLGSGYRCRPKVNATTGRVTFTPQANWSGQETVRFQATDDGPGNKYLVVNTTVIVEAVNDPPFVVGSIGDLSMSEETTIQTPDISAIFQDIDDTGSNLTYALRIISQDTRPPDAKLNISRDPQRQLYTLGPARHFFGNFTLEASCSDNRLWTVPATVRFNLTVTHRNHAPLLAEGVLSPVILTVEERGSNSELVVPELFTDVDMDPAYANDSLNFTVTGMSKLSVRIGADGRLLIETGTEQYFPGVSYQENLVLTAKDRAGLKAILNVTVQIVPLDDTPYFGSFLPDNLNYSMQEGRKEMFRVSVIDNDTQELKYAWYLNGVKDSYIAGTVYNFQTDSSMGGTVHTLRVDVSDGRSNISVEWTITILDVNRAPLVRITSPANFTKFEKGKPVSFQVDASDPDGDPMNYTWTNETGAVIGTGAAFSTSGLMPGTIKIRLEVSDGKSSSFAEVTVIIAPEPPKQESKGGMPGFTTAAALAAAGIVVAVAVFVRRRKEE